MGRGLCSQRHLYHPRQWIIAPVFGIAIENVRGKQTLQHGHTRGAVETSIYLNVELYLCRKHSGLKRARRVVEGRNT